MLKYITPLIKHVLCRLAECDSGLCPLIKKKKKKKTNRFSTPLTHPALCSPFQSVCLFHQNLLVPAAHTHTLINKTHSCALIRQPQGSATNTSDRRDETVVSKTTTSFIQIYDAGCWNQALFLFSFFFPLSRCAVLTPLSSKGKARTDHVLSMCTLCSLSLCAFMELKQKQDVPAFLEKEGTADWWTSLLAL